MKTIRRLEATENGKHCKRDGHGGVVSIDACVGGSVRERDEM